MEQKEKEREFNRGIGLGTKEGEARKKGHEILEEAVTWKERGVA